MDMITDFKFSDEDVAAASLESTNAYLKDATQGLALIARLTSAARYETDSDHQTSAQRLHQLIHQSFVSLAVRDDYPAEAQSFRDLIELEESLKNLMIFPTLANKKIVGVGGAFSAGKSRFLNTLAGIDLLPESSDPTTAIPSYIIAGAKQCITAVNAFGYQVEMDVDALEAITHKFRETFQSSLGVNFGFAHIVKLLMVEHPSMCWQNIAFLDTPGYDKNDGKQDKIADESISRKQLSEADYVLWLISAERGTIPHSDIEFLRTLSHSQPIYVVITKADFKARDITSIVDAVRTSLDDNGIAYAGIMAWSAPLHSPASLAAGDDIRDWLQQLDDSPKTTTRRRACSRVLDAHISHNAAALANNKKLLAAMNELLLIADSLSTNRQAAIQQQIAHLQHEQRNLKGIVPEFEQLKSNMLDAVSSIVGSLAQDEDQAIGHEMRYTVKREWLKRDVSEGETFDIRVLSLKGDVKRMTVMLGDDILTTAFSFAAIRGGLRVDPMVFTSGSVLLGEVRKIDEKDVLLAITNPYGAAS